MKRRRALDPLQAALLLAFGAKLAAAVAALGRGFEMGDEGYFLLNLNHAEAALPPMEFYRVLARITGGAAIGVVPARALRLVLELAGSAALVAGVFVWARARFFAPGAVRPADFLLLCTQGTLISVASRSLGYNDVTNFLTYAAVGCLFVLAALGEDRRGRRRALAAAVGALTACQLSVKFPTAFLLVAAFATVVALALRTTPLRERLLLLAIHGATFLGVAAALVAASGGARAMAAKLEVASRLPALTGYSPVDLLRRYLLIEQWTLTHLAAFLLAGGGAFALARARAARTGSRWGPEEQDGALVTSLGVATAVLLTGVAVWRPPFLHVSLVVLACLLLGLVLGLLALRWIGEKPREPGASGPADGGGLVLLLLLLAVPFVVIAGTNVGVTMRLPTHALPLFVLLALLVLDLRGRGGAERFHRSVALLCLAVTSVVFVHHHWLHPYGLRRPMHEQRSAVAGLPDVRVDLGTSRFLEEVAGALREAGFRRGDALVAFDYMPGLVYYAGGRSPRYNLYMFDLPAFNCFNWSLADSDDPPFIVLGRPMSPAQRACLSGLRFPEDFELVRTLRFPYEEVYAGFGARDFSHLYLYAPAGRKAADAE